MMTSGRSLAAWLLVIPFWVSRVAQASPLSNAELEAREAEAKRACEAGRVDDGARALGELLRLTGDGTYIFNLGRCHQQNGQAAAAAAQFRAYLQRSDVDPTAAARARDFIAQYEARPLPVPPPAAADTVTSPPEALHARAPVAAGRDGHGLRLGGMVTAAGGLAALATGAYFALETHRLDQEKSEALAAKDTTRAWFEEQNEKGARAQTRQRIFLIGGGAALALGGVLYYLGTRASDATVTPVAWPGGAGGVVAGRF